MLGFSCCWFLFTRIDFFSQKLISCQRNWFHVTCFKTWYLVTGICFLSQELISWHKNWFTVTRRDFMLSNIDFFEEEWFFFDKMNAIITFIILVKGNKSCWHHSCWMATETYLTRGFFCHRKRFLATGNIFLWQQIIPCSRFFSWGNNSKNTQKNLIDVCLEYIAAIRISLAIS